MAISFDKEKEYLPLAQKYGSKYGVSPALILAHIKQESSFNPNAYRNEPAINDASMGLMQMLVRTAKSFDSGATLDKLRNPEYSIDLGTQYISQNLRKWPKLQDAIAAYNAGVPRLDEEGYYVNSKGDRMVQKYVDKVYGNYVEYNDWLGQGAKSFDLTMMNPVWPILFIASGVTFIVVRRLYGSSDRVGSR